MLILAGLGNPGSKYAKNRHNIGQMAVDAIAARWGFSAPRARFSSIASEGSIETADGRVRALILKPQTFYNDSGRAIAEAMKFYKLSPDDVVVFY
ncbi:MAG TPA: aminoacyl-tRNA hydrolase, partial [Caulobacteraceae bacterium]|nr:aminoacyl-tRNA hydrolase [Caulobacteraceae bacterium]